MLRQSILIIFAFFALSANANTNPENDPYSDIIALEIEKVELEDILFNTQDEPAEIISVASITVYEIEEEVNFNFNPENYLPDGFDARVGMYDLDWNTIRLVELEEEVDLGFDPKDHLPANFDPFKGMTSCDDMIAMTFF